MTHPFLPVMDLYQPRRFAGTLPPMVVSVLLKDIKQAEWRDIE
jgi:hypothetical protein